jgi:hypothetical protein
MSQVKESPVKRFAGSVTIPDYLNLPQLMTWREAFAKAQAMRKDAEGNDISEKLSLIEFYHALLPGILACVEKWDIPLLVQPVTVDNFPASPVKSACDLVSWLIKIINPLLEEADDIPNA